MVHALPSLGSPFWKTLTPSTNPTSKKSWKIPLPVSPTNDLCQDDRLACNNPNKRAKVLVIHKDGSTEVSKVFRRRHFKQEKA